jgi:hypothetical protein
MGTATSTGVMTGERVDYKGLSIIVAPILKKTSLNRLAFF